MTITWKDGSQTILRDNGANTHIGEIAHYVMHSAYYVERTYKIKAEEAILNYAKSYGAKIEDDKS